MRPCSKNSRAFRDITNSIQVSEEKQQVGGKEASQGSVELADCAPSNVLNDNGCQRIVTGRKLIDDAVNPTFAHLYIPESRLTIEKTYIGSGGYGDVSKGYLSGAVHCPSSEIVAVKRFRKSDTASRDFLQELETLVEVSPLSSAVTVLGWTVLHSAKGRVKTSVPALILEYLDFGDLLNFMCYLEGKRMLEFKLIVQVILDALMSLLQLHSISLGHGDVKAENFLVEEVHVKLQDGSFVTTKKFYNLEECLKTGGEIVFVKLLSSDFGSAVRLPGKDSRHATDIASFFDNFLK
ncbi:hypothetical protein CYMTET_52506 [Cymbomonas tetramitiformis]|uniref:Protein kinase domain-containing protein n=1 Tax=Cymbomonas tetramitiformis TaxID=36881 RepID=A0AAE0BKQ2_9CHLO|nr:hypothetical protein CYMTET_52506 [Cymbomonas tetramitiformis]